MDAKQLGNEAADLEENVRLPEDLPWWQYYDAKRKEGASQAWAAYYADMAIYGGVVNNPMPKERP